MWLKAVNNTGSQNTCPLAIYACHLLKLALCQFHLHGAYEHACELTGTMNTNNTGSQNTCPLEYRLLAIYTCYLLLKLALCQFHLRGADEHTCELTGTMNTNTAKQYSVSGNNCKYTICIIYLSAFCVLCFLLLLL